MILGILVGSVLLIVWAVNRSNAKPGNPGVTPPPIEHSTEARLRDLDALRARGVVTEAEYAERRAAILQSL
ncbi:MAG: SHOCT domain-containing protein [Pseudoxanthomonas sp.]